MFFNDEYEDDDLIKVFDDTEEVKTEDPSKVKKVIIEEEIIEESTIIPNLVDNDKDGLAPITITKEMRQSFLEYAMSVIVSRALPDARDGLKPVHRRIIYGMFELGVLPGSSHKKSARIVGDVLGKYHPHGDSAVYEAMVRMAQDFSMRYPMVDGQGNFGSIDGDSAAAMRYTEARMSKVSGLMIENIRKNTVDFVPNYDGSDLEPSVLPSRIPNLLISGGTGIAVGMATSLAPHNLREAINGAIAYARNNEITIEELMTHIPAPDFPTGGNIIAKSRIPNAYATGRGSVVVRSKTEIEELSSGKTRIVVTEIPYMVNKAKLVEKIAILVKDKAITGITDLRDETSRMGIRIVIELKKDVYPEVVRNQLFKMTSLQTNFSINMLALVDGEPKTLSLRDALEQFMLHQKDIVTRRIQFDLDKAQVREHILKGLKIAIENIDEVISVIRASKTDEETHNKLINRFKLSEKQAKAITQMRLGRLNGLAIDKMIEELEALSSEIKEHTEILADENKLLDLIIKELEEIRDKFGDDRRTVITDIETNIEDEDLIPVKDIAITMSSKGYVKRMPLEQFQIQKRGGIGSKAMSTYGDDDVEKIVTTSTHTDLLMITTYGKVYRIRAHQIPELSKQSKGIPFINLIDIEKEEKVVSIIKVEDDKYQDGIYLATFTKNGIIKKTSITEYNRINKNGKLALGMKEGDELVGALLVEDGEEIVIGSSYGKVVRFNSSDVRSMGRTATGVKGIDLSDGKDNNVVGSSKSTNGELLLAIGENGFGKLTSLEEYRLTKRGAKGVKTIDVKKAGKLKFVRVVEGKEDLLITTKQGTTIRIALEGVSRIGRSAKGVKIIRLREKDSIEAIATIESSQIQEAIDQAIKKTTEINLSK